MDNNLGNGYQNNNDKKVGRPQKIDPKIDAGIFRNKSK